MRITRQRHLCGWFLFFHWVSQPWEHVGHCHLPLEGLGNHAVRENSQVLLLQSSQCSISCIRNKQCFGDTRKDSSIYPTCALLAFWWGNELGWSAVALVWPDEEGTWTRRNPLCCPIWLSGKSLRSLWDLNAISYHWLSFNVLLSFKRIFVVGLPPWKRFLALSAMYV